MVKVFDQPEGAKVIGLWNVRPQAGVTQRKATVGDACDASVRGQAGNGGLSRVGHGGDDRFDPCRGSLVVTFLLSAIGPGPHWIVGWGAELFDGPGGGPVGGSGSMTGEAFEIRVRPDGAVGVQHRDGGRKAVLCTSAGFANFGDRVTVRYSWSETGGQCLQAENLTNGQSEARTTSLTGIGLNASRVDVSCVSTMVSHVAVRNQTQLAQTRLAQTQPALSGQADPASARLPVSSTSADRPEGSSGPGGRLVSPCFTPGTLIATPTGERPVEDLRPGDRVVTRDNGIQEIRWVGQRRLTRPQMVRAEYLKPIHIRAGALGDGLPERDMQLSPNHRVLVSSDKTALYFREREVLVAAKHLLCLDGVEIREDFQVTYLHLLFDRHEVILSDGTWTESFQPDQQTLSGLGNAQRTEIHELFPELKTPEGVAAYRPARRLVEKRQARLLFH